MLMVFDVDDTLAYVEPYYQLLPKDRDAPKAAYEVWRDTIIAQPPAPLVGAVDFVNYLIDTHDPKECGILTGRGKEMQDASVEWIAEHFPRLYERLAWASFRDDMRPNHISKTMRLGAVRGDNAVWLFDDNPKMILAASEGDLFSWIEGEWPPKVTLRGEKKYGLVG